MIYDYMYIGFEPSIDIGAIIGGIVVVIFVALAVTATTIAIIVVRGLQIKKKYVWEVCIINYCNVRC